MIPVILSIAGSDCSGGAGIQADLKTISALGGYAATAITALTAQNTLGVQEVYPVTADMLDAQLTAVLSDLQPKAVKIGMLPDATLIRTLVATLDTYRPTWVVCDPVMISTSGRRLMAEEAVSELQQALFPRCTLITPNLHEAAYLSGTSLVTQEDMQHTAQWLATQYNTSVLIKGGHLTGETMTDVLFHQPQQTFYFYTSEKIASKNLHGTGCTLSSAIATYLAKGIPLEKAVDQAKQYMQTAIARGRDLNIGQGNGPLGHFQYLE